MSRVILLDNEAVHALANPAHTQHRRVVSHAVIAARRKARATPVSLAVPSAVRVEAGRDRTAPAWALANRLRVADIPSMHATPMPAPPSGTGPACPRPTLISGAAMITTDQVTVMTSDPGDMRIVAEGKRIEVVAL